MSSEDAASPDAPAPSLRRIVLRGAGLTSGGQLATQILTFGVYLVLARLASPSTFGAFAAASILVNAGSLLVESGMSSALIQRRGEVDAAASTAFVATVLGGVVFSILAAVASPLVGLYFHSRTIGWLALAISATHLITSVGVVPNALLQRDLAFRRRLIVDPGSIIALGAVGIVGLELDWGVWALLAAAYASVTARVILLWLLTSWRPRPQLASVAMWRELARYARHILAAEILREGSRVTIVGMIGRFLGAAALGQYNFGARFAQQANSLISGSTAYVLFPAFARLAHDEARFRQAFARSLRLLTTISMPVSLLLLPLGQPMVVLLLGHRWSPAGDVLSALCGILAGYSLMQISAEAVKAAGDSASAFRMQIVLTLSTIVLVLAAYPLGLTGVAAAVSVSAAVVGVYSLQRASRLLGTRLTELLLLIARPLAAAGVMAVATLGVEHFVDAASHGVLVGLVLLAAEGLGAFVLYLGLLATLQPERTMRLVRGIRTGAGADAPLQH
jgi:O-antigen/teichoic acid export membrane protein